MADPQKIPAIEVSQPVEEEDRELLVGVIGPETGEESTYGLQTVAGVEQALRRVNDAGGLQGKPIKMVHFDDKGNPAVIERVIRELIQQKAIAIIAAPTGWSTFSPIHLVNDSKTLFMAVGTRRNIGRGKPYVFRFALPDETAIDDLLQHAVSTGLTRFALVSSSTQDDSLTLGSQFKQSMAKVPNGEIALEADLYDPFSGQIDHNHVIQSLKDQASTYQAVLFTGDALQGAELAKSMRHVGLSHPILGGEALFSPEFLQTGGQAVEGTLLYASHAPEQPGVLPDRFAALAYDAFSLLAQAMQKAGSPKTSKVQAALLNGETFDGMTGRSGFTSQGEPNKHPFLYRVTTEQKEVRFVLLKQKN